jgi:Stress responsive A/B Barrel Domain
MLRHVVIWSMAEGHEEELDDVLRELRELPDQIEEIAGLSAGRLLNESESEAVLCVDVADDVALERYRAHPAHQPVLTRLRDTASELVAADYEY